MANKIHAVASLAVIAAEINGDGMEVEFSIQKQSVFFSLTKDGERLLNVVEPIAALESEVKTAHVISSILLVIEENA